MIRERILFRLFFSLLLLLSFSPFCTYEPTSQIHPSNPDVDQSRSKYNFHLVEPSQQYRVEAERQISAAGCRTRTDSIRVVEVLFTATPDFFKEKNRAEVKAFFTEVLRFFEKQQAKETILSAVVHMDEKTPHMHLCFEIGRASCRERV